MIGSNELGPAKAAVAARSVAMRIWGESILAGENYEIKVFSLSDNARDARSREQNNNY